MDEGDGRFGALLRACRRSAGLSQEELAERSGLNVRTVRNLERGHSRWPYRDTLHRLADALNLDGSARADFIAGAGRRLGADSDGGDGAVAGAAEADAPRSAGQRTVRPGSGPVPRQLPAAIRHFAGRKAELDFLTAVLEEPGPPDAGTVAISAIDGMAGVGKTALAVHWAHQHAAGFPDGQLYADLRGFDPEGVPVSAAVVVQYFLSALDVPPERVPVDTDAQFGLYRSMLAGRRMLIILDNARDAGQVRPLLPGAAGCLVLITSRSRLTGLAALDGAVPLPVGLLTPDEARDLLASRLGAARVAREQPEADELAVLCARLPLALNIAAARIAARPAMPLREMTARLRDAGLDLLAAGPGHADVRAVFSWSYHALSPPGARLFRLLGLHGGPDITLSATASLTALDDAQARRALDELTAANLLTEHLPGRYIMHDLLRAYAAEQAHRHDSDDERRAAIRRVLDHYLLSARTAALLFLRHGQPPPLLETSAGVTGVPLADWEAAQAWYRAEQAVLPAAIALAVHTGFAAHAWQLGWAIGTFPDQRIRWQELVTTGQIVLAAAERADDLTGRAYSGRLIGHALFFGGHYAQSRDHLQQAANLFGQSGDRVSQADTELTVADTFNGTGQPAQALAHCQRLLATYQDADDAHGQARVLNNLGWYHLVLGNDEQGLAYCEKAIDLIRHSDAPKMRYSQAATLDSIGYAHFRLGHHADAIASYTEAVRVTQSVGEIRLQAGILDHLGDAFLAAADPIAACDAWKKALAILDDFRHPDAEQVRSKIRDHEC